MSFVCDGTEHLHKYKDIFIDLMLSFGRVNSASNAVFINFILHTNNN